jgi:hypothetical protein
MTAPRADLIQLEMAGAQLDAALEQGDAVAVMQTAAEIGHLTRRIGAASTDDPTLRPALRAMAGRVVRALERLAEMQESALAARIRDRRVQAAYGAGL